METKIYRVIEREKKGEEFKTLAEFRTCDKFAAINWASGYAFAFASYNHGLDKPCVQSIDGYFWYNNKVGYELRVVDGDDNNNIIK